MRRSENPLAVLFRQPSLGRWLPAFAAAAIADPIAARALGPYLGPPTEHIEGGKRPRVPGAEHFARTWAVIRPGFLGQGSATYAEYTNAEHRRTHITPHQLALPIMWLQVVAGTIALESGFPTQVKALWAAGRQFGRDIHADPTIVALRLNIAKANMAAYFNGVTILPEQGWAFWGAMRHPVVMRDLGDMRALHIQQTLARHLPRQLVAQFVRYKPQR